MQILNLQQNTPEWLAFKRPNIGGSDMKKLYLARGGRSDEFYQKLAYRIGLFDDDGSSDRERGHEKEVEALEMFEEETGKAVNKEAGVWLADFNDHMHVSPDGAIANKDGIYTEACEVKCLAAKNHLRAVIENKIPKEFWLQVLQYFIINEDLQILHFVFYDDRITARPFHMIDVTRDEVSTEVEKMKRWEIETLEEVEKLALELNGF